MMKDLVNQCTFQFESNTSALEILGSDLTNKDEAFFINKATKDITKNNKSIKDMKLDKVTNDLFNLPNKRTQQWSKMTQKNVQASQAIRADSQKLRTTVNNVCNQAVAELKQHWIATNTAFNERIKETEETQKKLQSHLNKTLHEIKDQERHIEQLRSAVKAKGQPLK